MGKNIFEDDVMKMYRCYECKSAFMRPLHGKCPMCGNPNIGEGIPMKSDLRFTGEEKGGKYKYKDADTGKEKWLEKADENVTGQIRPTQTDNGEIEEMNKRLKKKKQQSDYHKKRYKMIKAGKWKGHL